MQKMESKKKTKSSSNSTRISKFNYLPPEVWAQILPNIPAKTLVKFRCVCKSWCDIIDNPDFVTQHRNLCKINSVSSKLLLALEGLGRFGRKGCLLTVRRADALRKTYHILKSSQRYHLLGNCNELLLVHGYIDPGHRDQLMLWNPCIRKSLRIPLPPLPSFDFIVYLFGFALCSNEYKVIAMSSQRSVTDGIIMCCALYTLSDQQWSLRNEGLDMSFSYFVRLFRLYGCPPTGCFFQGAAHWIGDDPNQGAIPSDCSTHLVSLDFDLEKFTYLELPFASEDRGAIRFPFRLRESLAVFCISFVKSSIWALDEESGKGAWTPRFSGLSSCGGFYLFSSRPRLPLFYYESDHGSCFVYRKMAYNIASCKVHELGKSMGHFVDLRMYMEGLVLCKGYGAEDLLSLAHEQENATISNGDDWYTMDMLVARFF
ncbi:F-box/kelch-repeat protein At3g23880-like [Silene latifolia]|uniref:F-box/kelch-repeat protein At3g23880-like n=1 Tax=Silene latifolia TaxID=37657 RepID=UPI003D789C10